MGTPANYGPMTEVQMNQDEIESVVSKISNLGSDGLMVEWGSGGSTVKWLESMKDNQRLISIEHNKEWYDKVNGYVQSRDDIKNRLTYYHQAEKYPAIEPLRITNHEYPHHVGTILEEHPFGLDQYFFPDADILSADIFFIDGLSRGAIALMVNFLAQKDNAVVYIHDYVGREHWYNWATQFFTKKEVIGSTLVRLYM
jgi:hypothetical protein